MTREKMVGFGAKQAWLAIRDGAPDAIRGELRLRDLGPVSWRDGVDLAYLTDDRLVLTPPLPGAGGARWTLVAGRWLMRARPAVDLAELSRQLDTEVQSFTTYRVGEVHGWARADAGVLLRAFRYVGHVGEVTDWRGEVDRTELAIGLPHAFDAEADEETSLLVGEDDVRAVARAWSVDPIGLDGQPAPGPLHASAID